MSDAAAPTPSTRPARSSRPPSRRDSTRSPRPSAPGPTSCPRSGSCSAPGSAASPTTSRTRSRSRSPTCPAGPPRRRPGHAGRLLLGRLGGRRRRHAPGPLPPVRGQRTRASSSSRCCCSSALGARIVVLTNAAGGLDPSFGPGTLMVMRDHINLTGLNPLIGPNADALGAALPRPDRRLEPAAARRAARGRRRRGRRARRGHLRRPDRAELRDARPRSGCCAGAGRPRGRDVDRARVHRRALGRPRGLRRLAGDERRGRLHGEPLTHEEVLAAGAEAGPRLARVLRRFLADLPEA